MNPRFPWLRGLCRHALTFAVLVSWGLTFFAFRYIPDARPSETVAFPKGWVLSPFVLGKSGLIVLQDSESWAGGQEPRKILVWDVNARQTLVELDGLTGSLRSVAVSPDGQTLATVAQDEVVRVWDRHTTRELRTLRAPGKRFERVAFAPDGQSLVAMWGSGARRWNLADGKELATLSTGYAESVAVRFGADGQVMVVASNTNRNTMEFWNLNTGRHQHTVDLSQCAHLYRYSISPDGRTLVTAHQDGAVKLWDIATGEVQAEHLAPDLPYTLTISPDGKRVAVGYIDSSAIMTAVSRQLLAWDPQPGPWLSEMMSANCGTMVIDRATSECWHGLPFSFPYSDFLADGSRMVRFQPDGVQLFDLPPARQLFSPLAWVFLAVAVALTGVWWRLRHGGRAVDGVPSPLCSTTP